MISNNLSQLMGKQKIKMTELCRMTGISYTSIFNLYHEKSSGIDFKTLDKLCNVLDCSTQELFEFKKN